MSLQDGTLVPMCAQLAIVTRSPDPFPSVYSIINGWDYGVMPV